MWWYRYPYPYWMPYPSVTPPYDIFAMMSQTINWMIYPYYWMLYLEAFRASFDVWKKAMESFSKYVVPETK